ncbi:MAG: prefoldin subunit beta, partial [Methanosarcinales archaeon]|nr:prefoldin subunit beta [Methanosarcinales archaeon]
MSGELPPQVQNQLAQLQQVQQQAQALAQQKNQLEIMVKESDMALEELGKIDEDVTVFKNIG